MFIQIPVSPTSLLSNYISVRFVHLLVLQNFTTILLCCFLPCGIRIHLYPSYQGITGSLGLSYWTGYADPFIFFVCLHLFDSAGPCPILLLQFWTLLRPFFILQEGPFHHGYLLCFTFLPTEGLWANFGFYFPISKDILPFRPIAWASYYFFAPFLTHLLGSTWAFFLIRPLGTHLQKCAWEKKVSYYRGSTWHEQ